MRVTRVVLISVLCVLLALVMASGCGSNKKDVVTDETGGRPEAVTAYEAAKYTKAAANKWQSKNWVIEMRDDDPDGLNRVGKSKIWEVYFFSPTPEENSQMFVIYNRGNVWPNAPGGNKGSDKGRKIYRENKPEDFRVDSPEAYNVALRNGGGDFLDAHPDANVHAVLRCKADYDALAEAMPAPKYKWIWDVVYREPRIGAEVLHVMVDGMNGDFITKELKTPTQ